MPHYDYHCSKCGSIKEDVFHGMHDSPRITCPKCKTKMKKLIGKGAGVIFKGEGFYETDYKRKRRK